KSLTGDVSAATALATGATTARTLAAMAGDVANVLNFIESADADLTNGITRALATGNAVYIPAGDYTISGDVALPATTRIYGQKSLTVLTFTGTGSLSISSTVQPNIEIENISFVAAGSAVPLALSSAYQGGFVSNSFVGKGLRFSGNNTTAPYLVSFAALLNFDLSDCLFSQSTETTASVGILGGCLNFGFTLCKWFGRVATGTGAALEVTGGSVSYGTQGGRFTNCLAIGFPTAIQIIGPIDYMIWSGGMLDQNGMSVSVTGTSSALSGTISFLQTYMAQNTVFGVVPVISAGFIASMIISQCTIGPEVISSVENPAITFTGQSNFVYLSDNIGLTSSLITGTSYLQNYVYSSNIGLDDYRPGNSTILGNSTVNGTLLVFGTTTIQGNNLNVGGSANNLALAGAATGSPVGVSAFGSDADIELTLAAKGNSSIVATSPLAAQAGFRVVAGQQLQLGTTYAAGAPTITGSIAIQDSTGTVYYLAVGTAA
ncbi:MAG TPA: hypothetical protein PK677_17915, partial [Acidiphilium sp.]|nr:hypothetical protein [Acidiphilium sp.]